MLPTALIVICAAIIINIAIIINKNTSPKVRLANKFCLGIMLMIVSLLGGFTVGAYIIFLAVVVWANILIKNYDNTKTKLTAVILLALTLLEVWLLKPG